MLARTVTKDMEKTKTKTKTKRSSRSDLQIECRRKKPKMETEIDGGSDFLDALPDDLVVLILSKLSSSADSRSDFINILITCKRLKGLAMHPLVLSKASPKCYMVRASNWCESAHRFIKLVSDAGNIEACYTLGMIRFYCLQSRASGASLIAKAAVSSYAPALYSLALIQFNGSGRSTTDKDLRAGIALCARAAFFGHDDALSELGHSLQDGYGITQDIAEGGRFLAHASGRELSSAPSKTSSSLNGRELASWFMAEWFQGRWGPGREKREEGVTMTIRMCSEAECGRPETRPHEFRRCSVCASACYCSRVCQARDWKLRHKTICSPLIRWQGLGTRL